jgi:ketosteroid isomerase-like protein
MKSTVLCILLFAAAVVAAGCAPARETPEQMVAEAKALDQRWLDAYNKKDLDAIMALYWNSPDLVSFPPGVMEIRGWENVKQGFTKEFAEMKDGKLELMETSNNAAGDVVLGSGKWRFTMTSPLGAPIEVLGRYMDAKAKRDGKWVYIMDHASAPLPPPDQQTAK